MDDNSYYNWLLIDYMCPTISENSKKFAIPVDVIHVNKHAISVTVDYQTESMVFLTFNHNLRLCLWDSKHIVDIVEHVNGLAKSIILHF